MGRPNFSGCQVGRYLLTNIIGVGYSATVYRAVDTTSKHCQPWAIKCLKRNGLSRERSTQLISEIFCMGVLKGCQNIVPMRDILDEDGFIFLVLDLRETTMFRAIKNDVYWRNDELIRKAFLEILDGVSECHDRQVYHRDLKPENIMCNFDGTGIQIADFGLATTERVCQDGGVGSPSYMSPECYWSDEGDPYRSRPTDIWALGVVLFNMVTGEYPWQAAVPWNKEFQTFMDDPDYLFYVTPISEGLNDVLKWVFHPIPKKRMPIRFMRQRVMEMTTFYKSYRPPPSLSVLPKNVQFSTSQETHDERRHGVMASLPRWFHSCLYAS